MSSIAINWLHRQGSRRPSRFRDGWKPSKSGQGTYSLTGRIASVEPGRLGPDHAMATVANATATVMAAMAQCEGAAGRVGGVRVVADTPVGVIQIKTNNFDNGSVTTL